LCRFRVYNFFIIYDLELKVYKCVLGFNLGYLRVLGLGFRIEVSVKGLEINIFLFFLRFSAFRFS